MEWVKRMNTVLDYIEANLDGEISGSEIAKLSACSEGLFQRVFALVTDIPLSEYIRKRRLSKAAEELVSTRGRVLDTAVKYGYESADAFSAAFKRMHAITPTDARRKRSFVKLYPRLSFTISVKGATEMNYRIIEKGPFKVAGVSITTTPMSPEVSGLWDKLFEDGTHDKLLALSPNEGTLGICYDMKDDGTFSYMVGISVEGDAPEPFEGLDIPASTWIAFEAIGPLPHSIQDVIKRIYSEFMPQSAYTHAGTPELEVYYPGDSKKDDYRCEVWIPGVKK